MKSPAYVLSVPTCEAERLLLLDSYNIMYSERDPAFDRICELVRNYFDMSIVAISFIGRDEQFVKSAIGLDATVISRGLSFCQYTLMGTEPIIITDTLKSELFADHPWVIGEPYLRFYVGAPIVVENAQGEPHVLGSLCVLDTVPREAPSYRELRILEHFAGIISDTLELRRQKQLALKANDTKSAFLANISHEIRSPMNGITGILDLLAHTRLDTEQRQYVTHLKNANDYLLNIMDDMLDLSKVTSGQGEFNHQVFDAKSLSEQVIAGFTGLANEQGVKLVLRYHADVPRQLISDVSKVRQILARLVQNGIQLTQHGKQVCVCVRCKDGYINWHVNDRGVQLSDKTQAVIFDAYEHANHWLHRLYGGLGLGLSVCHSMAEGLGGRLLVTGESGKGNTFTLQLPMVIPRANGEQSPTKPTDKALSRLSASILLAEDNEVNAVVAIKTLKKYGYSVHRVKNGQEAVEAFGAAPNKYQIILMDHQMPIMDGVEATKLLKKKFRDLPPIIAVTAHATHGETQIYLNAGMQDFCAKPYKPEVLDKLIQQWLDKRLHDVMFEHDMG